MPDIYRPRPTSTKFVRGGKEMWEKERERENGKKVPRRGRKKGRKEGAADSDEKVFAGKRKCRPPLREEDGARVDGMGWDGMHATATNSGRDFVGRLPARSPGRPRVPWRELTAASSHHVSFLLAAPKSK